MGAGASGQPVIHIEQAVIQTGPGGALPAGGGAGALEAPPAARIDAPDQGLPAPRSRGREAPQGLPAPESPEPLPEAKQIIPIGKAREVGPAHAERPEGAESDNREVALRRGDSDFPDKPDFGSMLPALFKRLGRGRPRDKPAEEAETDTIDVEDEEANYRFCRVCATEILVEDNYCFHCGQKHHGGDFDPNAPRDAKIKSNFALHAFVILCLLAHVLAPLVLADRLPGAVGIIEIGTGLGAPLFALVALMRKPGFKPRALSFLILTISLFVVAVL